jgi:uncharacterized membrane protein
MITVTLYSRKECHLCDQARADLDSLKAEIPHTLVELDIDNDPKLLRDFGLDIPVVAVGPFRLKAPFSLQDLRITLLAATDRERHIDMVEKSPLLEQVRRQTSWTKADSFSNWISKHYMSLFNLMVTIYLGLAFLAPVLMKAKLELPATVLYKAYSLVCHQLGYRSFYLFGAQYSYPRAAAGVPDVLTFGQATGFSEGSSAKDLFNARSFVGNEQLGHKIALCERDIAIYGGILIFGLLFSLSGLRLPSIPWYMWIVIGIIPIGIDGFSQLLSQPPLSFLPYRESTPTLRVVTGFLFGFTTAWFGYPVVEESMREMRNMYQRKRMLAHPASQGSQDLKPE